MNVAVWLETSWPASKHKDLVQVLEESHWNCGQLLVVLKLLNKKILINN